ncbi:MAG: adenylate/guanylate cyclase domain-containing protein, partial [Pseudomonadota bacterium]
WRLVIWTGAVAVVYRWTAFLWVVYDMEQTYYGADINPAATRADYENIFLSIDFIGRGNRIEETGFLFVGALILALVVYRARKVFFAQIEAEEIQRQERNARLKVTQTLGRFVPEEIAEQIVADDGALAPREKYGTILIMDIAGFSTYAAGKPPADVITNLNRFLADCADVIASHSGVVISFTGDGLLASFNIPLDIEQPEQSAIEAANELVGTSTTTDFNIRIGIASGPVASGSIGSTERMAFTVYGTTVNRAARLENLCKELKKTILFDQSTSQKLVGSSTSVSLGNHALRGVSASEQVFMLAQN